MDISGKNNTMSASMRRRGVCASVDQGCTRRCGPATPGDIFLVAKVEPLHAASLQDVSERLLDHFAATAHQTSTASAILPATIGVGFLVVGKVGFVHTAHTMTLQSTSAS